MRKLLPLPTAICPIIYHGSAQEMTRPLPHLTAIRPIFKRRIRMYVSTSAPERSSSRDNQETLQPHGPTPELSRRPRFFIRLRLTIQIVDIFWNTGFPSMVRRSQKRFCWKIRDRSKIRLTLLPAFSVVPPLSHPHCQLLLSRKQHSR